MPRTRRAAVVAALGGALSTLLLASVAAAQETAEVPRDPNAAIDGMWVMVSAALVFFMQAGFMCLEVGFVRPRNINSVALKNLVDWVVVSLGFLLVGFAIMFGPSPSGVFGSGHFFGEGLSELGMHGWGFFMFQLAFCGTAATIVSGAMSERTGFVPYLVTSTVVGMFIYPFFGHWAWGNMLYPDNPSLLARAGFHDFAGSTVVHSIGGWVSLVGTWFVGPRIGRYDAQGRPMKMQGYSIPLAVLGTFILWFGWWGFNGGSVLSFDERVGSVIANTNAAACTGALAAFAHCYFFQKKEDITEKFIGGTLAGLVGVTAGADVLDIPRALAVGVVCGIAHNIAMDLLLKRFKIDDPVGAIPVHLVAGILGTLWVATADPTALGRSNGAQLIAQLFGVVACMIWTVGFSLVTFVAVKALIGLRVPPTEEVAGFDIAKSDAETAAPAPQVEVDAAVLRSLMEDE